MRPYSYRLFIIVVLAAILIVLLLTNITRCSPDRSMTTHFYAGRGDKWLVTYTVIKTNSMYYRTLYIQYLINSKTPLEELDGIYEIEYSLTGEAEIISSPAPQLLGDKAGFTKVNMVDQDSAKLVSGEELLITIKWSGYEEIVKLSKLE